MARRGKQLREHILFTAKDVFLELGFERASMDAVAAAAQTSKRSLYAHFDNKERLYLEVIEFVRELMLARIGQPGQYAENPTEALVQFCGRYLEILLYQGSVQMCRVTIAEAARFPQGATRLYNVVFTEIAARLGNYMAATFDLTEEVAASLVTSLLGRILYPHLPRALFGIDQLASHFDRDKLSPAFDLAPIRVVVTDVLAPLSRRRCHPGR